MTKFNQFHPVPCVYWKHGAYWYVKRGKWERIGATLEEALAEYGKRQAANKEGKLPALIESTLMHHCKVEALSENTRDQYRKSADFLKRRFKAFDEPRQIKARHIAQLKVEGSATPNMTNRHISLLKSLFGHWLEWGKADDNPCAGVRRFKEMKRKRLILMPEWDAIYAEAGPRLKVIMKVAFLTGQRIGDVLAIHRRQLTDEGVSFAQQKTGKLLTVAWSPDLRAAVDEALSLHRVPGMWLFMGRGGKHAEYRTVLLQWHTARKAAGVEDAKPNDQRAQSLTNSKKQGKNPTKLAGHSSPSMTERYLRERDSELVEGPNLRQALDVGQKR